MAVNISESAITRINTVNKDNDQKGKIKIKYDKLLKPIAGKDNQIKLQEQKIKEQKRLML